MTPSSLRPDRSDSTLDELALRYPGWRIWRGHATGELWALPPRDHLQRGLLSAASAEELEAKIAESGWHTLLY
jgi:hypothetical protein